MPHRVADFFSETFSAAAITSIKSTIRPQNSSRSPSRRRIERHNSTTPSLSDDGDEFAGFIQMYAPKALPDQVRDKEKEKKEKDRKDKERKEKDRKDKDKQHHRLSLHFGRSKESHENPHASLAWNIESPPIIFYGDVENSTGALVSGQVFLDVKDDVLEIESFGAALNIHVHHKRPFAPHCADCSDQYTELKRWTFLAPQNQPTTLHRGRHAFPFSILLDGHLPASMDTTVMSVAYEFKAETILARRPGVSTLPVKLDRLFDVKRSLPQSDEPHHSVRVFPPTNIKASAHYRQVIHPTSAGQGLQLRLDGLATVNSATNTVEYWKMKKITWKLEETVKTIAPACKKHAPAPADAEESTTPAKGLQRHETRVLGEKHMHEGWKSEYGQTDGHVELEFDFGVAASLLASSRSAAPGYACDARSRDGTTVSHALMVEMVVSKEWAPVGKPYLASQTGTGRILRMHYHVMLTDFPGLGVSWDNESPPVYQDVPPSPPAYPAGGPIDYEDLERLDAVRGSPELAVREWTA